MYTFAPALPHRSKKFKLSRSSHVHASEYLDQNRNGGMSETDEAAKLDELERILNDPDVPMEPARVWALLAEIAGLQAAC